MSYISLYQVYHYTKVSLIRTYGFVLWYESRTHKIYLTQTHSHSINTPTSPALFTSDYLSIGTITAQVDEHEQGIYD